ncbi:MAG: agmatinase family protein [Flavobacteriales bacterium]|nr:agmatinase family protein [Flavobacteriales bacterium]
MTKEEKTSSFNPSSAGLKDSNVYGLPFSCEEAHIVLIPVPWEVTVSYGSGASEGPAHILETSTQVDLYHAEFPALWKAGIAMDNIPEAMMMRSADLKLKASRIIEMWEDGVNVSSNHEAQQLQKEINDECEKMNGWVQVQTESWLAAGKIVGLVGGDHSTPLGYFRAQAARHGSFGILHIDAHMDLRIAYEGFTYSHASIMNNALQLEQITSLVQVAIRDYCEEEVNVASEHPQRVYVFTDAEINRNSFGGMNWQQQCDAIIAKLPEKVHISFDIDGLDPTLCPNTGTPVPGGLGFEQATYLLSRLLHHKKKIIGFDLVEVAPGSDDWNGNVGSRLLFHLCGVAAKSNGKV